jgi:hypothetical protein
MVTAREELHRLADILPEEDLKAVLSDIRKRQLETLKQVLADAPLDDEGTTPDEEAEVAEAWEEYRRGEYHTLREVWDELSGE